MSEGPTPVEPCDACDATDFETVATRDRRGKPLSTVLCTRCGLVRHLRLPTAAALSAYYAGEYRREYHGEEVPTEKRVVRAWRRGQGLYERLRAYVDADGSVFEVGAGLGLNLKPFQLAGLEARGIEPNEGFQQFSRETLRAPVLPAELEAIEPEPIHDLVILVHVIEHLRSPRQALRRLHALLRPEGLLYVECPNVAAPFAPRGRLFHRAHVHNFNPASLLTLAARCGFRLEKSFAGSDDPTIAVLLRSTDEERLEVDSENAARVRAAILRTGWLSYHLRARYLLLRAQKLREQTRELLTTRRAYARILAECAAQPLSERGGPEPCRE